MCRLTLTAAADAGEAADVERGDANEVWQVLRRQKRKLQRKLPCGVCAWLVEKVPRRGVYWW